MSSKVLLTGSSKSWQQSPNRCNQIRRPMSCCTVVVLVAGSRRSKAPAIDNRTLLLASRGSDDLNLLWPVTRNYAISPAASVTAKPVKGEPF